MFCVHTHMYMYMYTHTHTPTHTCTCTCIHAVSFFDNYTQPDYVHVTILCYNLGANFSFHKEKAQVIPEQGQVVRY